ncbi:MAG: DUF5719 family protein [Candidatus Nanopelagicales bacterium]
MSTTHNSETRTSWFRRPLLHLTLVILVLVGAGVTATQLAPTVRGPAPAAAIVVPVSETLVACPGLRSRDGFTESTIAAATPPREGQTDANSAGNGVVRTLTRDSADDKTLIQLSAPGDWGAYTGRNGERDSVTGSAEGSLAPGFSVTQTERTVDGRGRGLAGTQCLPTSNDFWFVGAASGVGERAVLVLTNPEDAVATVDVDVFARNGPVNAPAARGVQVPARNSVEVRLDHVAPGKPVLALHVQVRVGRLSAAVTETDVFGHEPRGTDWIPGAETPTTDLVVPGVPPTNQGREASIRLDVVAPTEAAVVSLQVVTAEGTFAPQGSDVIEVPAGGVESVDLTDALRGDAAAIVLHSDVDVTAGARVLLKQPGLFGDVLFLAASPPLTAPAVVPDNRATPDLATRILLSAPDGPATVNITAFAGDRQVPSQRVELPAGTSSIVNVTPPKEVARFGVVVAPTSNSSTVYGVRMLDEEGPRGPLVTSFPLRPARLLATVPVAIADVRAGTIG